MPPELKWHDVSLTNILLPHGSFFASRLNLVPQGLDATQRVGRKMWMTRLQLTAYAQRRLTSTDILNGEAVTLRWIVLYDNQPNNAGSISEAEVFADPTETGTSYPNLDNRARFIWLYDKLQILDPIKTVENDIQTFWTRTTRNTSDWTFTSWPQVAAFTTNIVAGGSVAANTFAPVPVATAALVPTVDTNVFADNQVIAMGDVNPPNNDADATHNRYYTYISNELSKKIEIDIDLYRDTEFSSIGNVETGQLWFIVTTNAAFIPDTNTQALVRWNSRIRFTDD